jgi:hypothetical protein
MLTGTPSRDTLEHVHFRELQLDPSDTRPLAHQLGLPPLLVLEVWNRIVAARRGVGGGERVEHTPTASSDVAVFYVAPTHERRRGSAGSLSTTSTGV